MQDLEPFLIFARVAEMGSFTRAANSLGIPKGRASTAVRRLEEAVGVRLLYRTTRSVRLTEDGFAGDRVALRGRLRVDLRPNWRERRSCRRCRGSWPPILGWSSSCRARTGRST